MTSTGGAQPAKTPSGGNPGDGAKRGQASGSGHASQLEVLLFVVFLLTTFLILMILLFNFWPEQVACPGATDGSLCWKKDVSLFGRSFEAGLEVRLFILVVVAGALGSFIHVSNSAADFIGNRNLVRSWIYWYVLRLPVGASLALIFYLLVRGGILTGTGQSVQIDEPPYGIVGISALAGMFAKKASNKLGDVFESIFRTGKDEELSDKNVQPPVLEEIQPNPLEVSGQPPAPATIKLIGKNFRDTSQVRFGRETRNPQFVGEAELSLTLESADLTESRSVDVLVVSTESGGAESAVVQLVISRPPAEPV